MADSNPEVKIKCFFAYFLRNTKNLFKKIFKKD